MNRLSTLRQWTGHGDEQKNAPELPIGRFLKSKSLGGNRVILVVLPRIPEPEPCERGAVRDGKPTRTKIRTAALRDLA